AGEDKVMQTQVAALVRCREWAMIPGPGVVAVDDGHNQILRVSATLSQALGQFCANRVTGNANDHALIATDDQGNLLEHVLDGGKHWSPIAVMAWPGQLDSILGMPFGKETLHGWPRSRNGERPKCRLECTKMQGSRKSHPRAMQRTLKNRTMSACRQGKSPCLTDYRF